MLYNISGVWVVQRRVSTLSLGSISLGKSGTTGSHLTLNSHFWFVTFYPSTPWHPLLLAVKTNCGDWYVLCDQLHILGEETGAAKIALSPMEGNYEDKKQQQQNTKPDRSGPGITTPAHFTSSVQDGCDK